MEKHTKNEIKVGIISIIGIILLVGIIVLAKGVSISGNSISVLIVFDNSLGITKGSPVVVNGVKRGVVDDVWNADDKVYIKTTLFDISDIREDASAVIAILEITGGKKIEISTGKSNIKYNPNKPIIGDNSVDLSTLISKLGGVTDNLTSIVTKLNIFTQFISDTNFTNQLQSIVSNTADATSELKSLLKTNGGDINIAVNNLKTISSDLKNLLNDNKPQIEKIIDNLDKASTELNIIIPKTNTTITDVNKLLDNINEIIVEIKSDNGGTVSKLLYDKQFSNRLDTLVQSFDSLAKHIQKYGINANVRLGGRP